MSPPAQNDLPTARITSAPTSARPSTSSNVAISSSAIPGVSALRRSGAFSVTIATAAVHLEQHLTGIRPRAHLPAERTGLTPAAKTSTGIRPRRPRSPPPGCQLGTAHGRLRAIFHKACA